MSLISIFLVLFQRLRNINLMMNKSVEWVSLPYSCFMEESFQSLIIKHDISYKFFVNALCEAEKFPYF